MNRLDISHNGGHPYTLDDLDFLQTLLKEAIKGHLSFLTTNPNDVVIISGVNLVDGGGGNWSWSDGYVLMSGDIFKVDAGSLLLAGGNVLAWAINTTYDSNGDKQYLDGNTYQTYEINKAAISQASSTSFTDPALTPTYLDKIHNVDDWHYVGGSGEPAFGAGFSNAVPAAPSSKLRFRKLPNGDIRIMGTVNNGTGSTGPFTLFTLPVAARPAWNRYFTVTDELSTPSFTTGRITPLGVVEINITAGAAWNPFTFDVTFPLN